MTSLLDIQNFFAETLEQIDSKQYPKTSEIILAFANLPKDFAELSIGEIETKTKKERKKYLLSTNTIKNQIPNIEERKHYIFTQIFLIYETLGNEMPKLIKLFFRFVEFIHIKDHTIVATAQKTIWSFLLAENIKYDLLQIEAALINKLRSFADVTEIEISNLTLSLEYLQNQLKSLKNLSLNTFNKH